MSTYLCVSSDLDAEVPVPYEKFGIVGDGKAFDHAGVGNLIDALDNHGRVRLGNRADGSAPIMLLGETVTLPERIGAALIAEREPNPEAAGVTPWFIWDGAPGGTMLSLDRCRRATLEGFVVQTDDPAGVRAPAGIGIALDGGPDTNGSGYGTACTLRRLRHVSSSRGTLPAVFIAIAATTKWNQEFHEIIECGGNGNGRGSFIHQGKSFNAKHTRVFRSRYVDAYDKAIWCENGSLACEYNNLSFNQWDYYLEGASGYYTVLRHIGEGSKHHAYINVPYREYASDWDPSALGPRPDAWVVIGPNCANVKIDARVGPPVAGTRLFKWDGDGTQRRVEIEVLLAYGYTRDLLGIDYLTLCGGDHPTMQAGALRFVERGHIVTPKGPGILDLPSGELLFDWREPTREYIGKPVGPDWGTLPDKTPSVRTPSKGPVDWATLTPGTSVDYIDTTTGYVRQQHCFPDGTYAELPVGAYKKVKP